ncbi:SKI8 (YGL213C) [Zygosaccharomyces parabailii]|uniref:ZYBA0S05-01486g1_1 n=1 Tax=Zygosaccharomyces bailii (strain CLIB 213 / ATCC 58445 / CBS 680 / BCRC 21525 / NBRC 1098 / NCYC 1416 / NRRL Y-2227) TaxID=1333698 RepID=A0A8J2X0D3_ZYGB2|nr:SKI8 (YGL213C) [Zygosaccharomyces parabailii]CDF89777.1 ZYBA0S05-01486g1_1 [Zygosaccharomyces bailii CLIB 213]CDH17536.1 related to Antiviral protein SKI8 [Zygosaccharomyces bailii ISA1307]
MSNVFISTANCGKAHDADIFGVSVCSPFTVTCSGDGTIKLWKNKLLDNELPKENVVTQFVHKTGVHHVDAFHSVEKGGHELCIIACVSFAGTVHFYNIDTKTSEISDLDMMPRQDKKRSFWAVKWFKSNDQMICHRLSATDVKGNTVVWRFHPFAQEFDEEAAKKEQDRRAKRLARGQSVEETPEHDNNEELTLQPHLALHGEIPSVEPVFATCVDFSHNGLIATGFANGSIVVSELTTLRRIHNFEGFGIQGIEQNSSTVRDVRFSPLGTLLAVASDSGSYGCVSLYETEYGERVGSLTVPTHSAQSSIGTFAHDGWVFGLSFNSTGEFLATCGYDSKVRIWDVKLRERISTLNISAGDIEIEEDIMLQDENGESVKNPPVLGVKFISKGVRGGMGSETNEGLCCVCLDRSVRWFRSAGGS